MKPDPFPSMPLERCRRQLRLWLLPACAMALPPATAVSAAINVPALSQPEQRDMAVRELMRLDTELALAALRQQLQEQERRHAKSARPGPDRSGPLTLTAIYGVGNRLLAEVIIDSTPQVFMRGRPRAIDNGVPDSGFRLRGISGSCVDLERHAQQHTLCLSRPGVSGRSR